MRGRMARIEDGELNRTMSKIMNYLFEELADGAKYVPYRTIAKEIGKSYHSVKYSIGRLMKMGMVFIEDGKLSLSPSVY